MARSSAAGRVLVVDDAPQIRALVRRVLSADGYHIDEAATLSQARSLAAAVYDAFVVDLRLGDGSGADLIEMLTASEPGASARCLVLTGGGLEAVPEGTAYLRKPFYPEELRTAVRALQQRAPSPAATGTSAAAAGIPVQPPQLPAGRDVLPGHKLLGMYRELRARERLALADYLHDGPVQDLTSAAYDLQMMRRTMPSGQARSLDAVRAALAAATASLRGLMDGLPSAPDLDLTSLLSERAGWLLSEPVAIDRVETGELSRAEMPVITETVALMLAGLVPAGSAARAHVAIRPAGDTLQVELTLTVPADGERALREPAAARGWLSALAAALQGTVTSSFETGGWLVALTLPRDSS